MEKHFNRLVAMRLANSELTAVFQKSKSFILMLHTNVKKTSNEFEVNIVIQIP